MKLYTLLYKGKEEVAVSFTDGNVAYLLRNLGFDFSSMNDFICNMTDKKWEELRALSMKDNMDAEVLLNECKILSPIPMPRQDIICLGINYGDHAIEAGRFCNEAFSKEREDTIYFSKRVNRATAPGEAIPRYEGLVDGLDYEVELGVIIGKDAKNVLPEDAFKYVLGYTIINDVSARNLQTRHKQWYRGKSLDGFTPMGPCILTADAVPDPQNLNIKCSVNGEMRQCSNTKYMIQSIAAAISELSQGMTLLAGTIIATGTPAGVGMGMEPPCFLQKGDVVTCEIQKIGILKNTVE